jgi:hypothetical protein
MFKSTLMWRGAMPCVPPQSKPLPCPQLRSAIIREHPIRPPSAVRLGTFARYTLRPGAKPLTPGTPSANLESSQVNEGKKTIANVAEDQSLLISRRA